MTINPFDAIAREYYQWFEDNRNIFLSELEAVKYFVSKKGVGVEIGVDKGSFVTIAAIKQSKYGKAGLSRL